MSSADKETPRLPDWLAAEQVDTVIVAFAGVYGRLLGKRMTRDFFLGHVVEDGTHACNYLLATNMDMEVLPGFQLASWEQGYGDFHVVPDMSTLRLFPWQEKTACVLGDLHHEDGSLVAQAPRSVLARQLERLAERGLRAFIGSELEFNLFDQDYRTIRDRAPGDMVPSSDYLIDYHILQPGRDENVLRRLRNEMSAAGITVECSKGEAGRGQHEVNLVFAEALEMADKHALYKTGAKDIAAQEGKSLTFMAKWWERDTGNGFHLHTSLWDADASRNLFWDAAAEAPGELFHQFLGGLLKYSGELAYFFAPTVNSYKRWQPGSWAPTGIVCGHDNRTCGLRVVGHGEGLRIENRMPGADANPYLTFAATLAAGLKGIEEGLNGEIYQGNAYDDETLPRLPRSLEDAIDLLKASDLAREAFGPEVVEFFVHTAELEADAFRRVVTDWERRRYFEQL